MSLTTSQKINQVINPKFLGFSVSENSNVKYDDDLAKDVDKLYELSLKLKEKLKQAVPSQSQVKDESNQLEDQELIENLNKIGKKFSFQSVDNLKKNIHLFDPKLERAQQQNLALLMNSLQSFSTQGQEDIQSLEQNSKNGYGLNNPVAQCLQILQSRWQDEQKYLEQKN